MQRAMILLRTLIRSQKIQASSGFPSLLNIGTSLLLTGLPGSKDTAERIEASNIDSTVLYRYHRGRGSTGADRSSFVDQCKTLNCINKTSNIVSAAC
jgi:hypothetical protein